jgi:uncharacterized repeat protein (TIGR03803 family)
MKTKIIFLAALFITASFPSANAQYTKLHDFTSASTGSIPYGQVISVGGVFYGTTSQGGTSNLGTIYKINPDGTGYLKLFDFTGGVIGYNPFGYLVSDGTFLYGMTHLGGTPGNGVIYKILPSGSGYSVIFNFNGTNGSQCLGSLIIEGGVLYGMTHGGGSGHGTIFKINTNGSGHTILRNFNPSINTDGQFPYYNTLISVGGVLYGMTTFGGTSGAGDIFKINPDGTGYTPMFNFSGASGTNPYYGALISDGTYLYGMTHDGGANGQGTIFRITLGGAYTKLLDFTGANGARPFGALYYDGLFLYGMTSQGGTSAMGVIFKIMPDGTSYSKLMDFTGTANGSGPTGSLYSDGTCLYGTTTSGGTNNLGTIFRYCIVPPCSPPGISCPANISVSNASGQCGANVTWPNATAGGTPTPSISYSIANGSFFSVGAPTTVTATATNACGTATCSFTVTVNDTQIPTITCPGNIPVNNDAGVCGAVVNYSTPVGTDNCTGSATTQTAGLGSGSTFPIGTTANTFKVTDASGNSASCSFNVIVTDTQFPAITCAGNITVGNDANSCGAIVSYAAPTASDNCSFAVGQESGLPSGAFYPVGTATTNTYVATDASGNSSACSFTVTVSDTQNPSITCPGNISGAVNNSGCTRLVTYTVSYGDNCSGSTLTQTAGMPSGSAFPKGVTTNTFKVTDASGNSATCSFTVTVTSSLSVYAGADEQTYYGYIADQTVTHSAVGSGGGGGYSYSWSLSRPLMCNIFNSNGDESFTGGSCTNNVCPGSGSPANAPSCSGSASVTAMLIEDADLIATVTDQYGCTAKDTFHVSSIDARCYAGNSGNVKVKVCHHTSSTTNPWVQICIAQAAVATHLAENNQDYIGTCSSRLSDEQTSSVLQMMVYPNPNNGNFTLDFQGAENGNTLVTITDVLGQIVYSDVITVSDGAYKGILDTGKLGGGIYLLQVVQGKEKAKMPVVIIR